MSVMDSKSNTKNTQCYVMSMTLRLEDLQLRFPLFNNFSVCLELFKVFILLLASAKQKFKSGLSSQYFAHFCGSMTF
jgi:hypothetical protein